MKFIKKISILMLMLAFTASALPAHAEETTEDLKYKNLTSTEISTLKEISEDNFEFKKIIESGGEVLSITSEVKTFYEQVPTKFGLSTYSIAPSKLRLTLTTMAGRYSNERVVVANAKWLTPPLIQRKDILAIAWGNGHAFKNNYSTTTNKYNPSLPVVAYLDNAEPNYGIGYKFDIKAPISTSNPSLPNYVDSVTVSTTLVVNKSGTTNVVAKYGHSTVKLGSISVSFGPSGPTPSIGFSIGVDTSVATTLFKK